MTNHPRRPLGKTDVEISPIGLGCMGMSEFYGTADDAKRTALIHHALDTVESLAEEKGITPAQLALAWLLHQGEHVVTIPGTTKKHRFDENEAANKVTLTAEDLAFLDENLPVGAAAGARY